MVDVFGAATRSAGAPPCWEDIILMSTFASADKNFHR